MSKQINARFQQKHDIEANWIIAGENGFVPKDGEIIVYDADGNFDYPRLKIGDGQKNVNELPFLDKAIWDQISTMNQIVAVDDGDGNIVLGATPLASVEGEEF